MAFTNFRSACKAASERARKAKNWRHVFVERFEGLEEFYVGSDFDADTFFAGQRSLATFGPDGRQDD